MLWSTSNEPESDTQGAVDYFESLFDLTRELDPTRPVCFVNALFAPAGKDRLAQFSDVIVIKRYSGWYTEPGDLLNAEDALNARAHRVGRARQAGDRREVRCRHHRRAAHTPQD